MGLTVGADVVAARGRPGVAPRGFGERRWVAPLVMLAAVGVAAGLPLIRNHSFYFWDDTAAVGVPMWHRIAQSVLHGHLPLLNLDMWRGGNFAAEAATGMWNPVVVLVAIAIYPIDNLAVGIALGKTFFILLMAGGGYLLARNYRVPPWLAATVGTALPLAGYSFFMDGTAWVNALMLTAFTPWVWWTARLVAHQGRSPLLLIATGYLAVSIGNPYGLLATGFVLLAVIVESWPANRRRVLVLLLSGVAVASLCVLVYLPLLLTSSVGFRAASQTLNDGLLKPSVTTLLELSSPGTQPFLPNFSAAHGNISVPVAYLAWFVLPMLPWLRWRLLRERWREHVGLYVFGGAVLLLMLGPSQIWMFRWPLRLIDFLWFPVLLLWALLAARGFRRDRWVLRASLSAVIVAVGAYLAWGERTTTWTWDIIGALVVLGLAAGAIRFGTGVLIYGSVVVLAIQVSWFPANHTVADYNFPTSAQLLRHRFAKYHGTTVQLADFGLDPPDRAPDRLYLDVLYGSMYSVAGVDSTTAYSGIGFTPMDSALCQTYQGSVSCPAAWPNLWARPAGYPVPLADLLRADTVVVQNSLVDTRKSAAPPGWHRAFDAEDSGLTTVWTRDRPLPWPGRLSYANVSVTADDMVGRVDESVSYRSDGNQPAELTFARLDWPGYRATVNGAAAKVISGPDGLVTVELPRGVRDGQVSLTWQPPGLMISLVCFVIGLLLSIGLAVIRRA